jgi:hypothetical protein
MLLPLTLDLLTKPPADLCLTGVLNKGWLLWDLWCSSSEELEERWKTLFNAVAEAGAFV